MEQINTILDYWFEGIDESTEVTLELLAAQRWFKKSDETDKEIADKFASDLTKARKGKYESWLETAEGSLALIILLDQFSRNIFRDSAKAFDTDLQVLEYSLRSIKRGFDQKVFPIKRQFFYLPLMHSENLKVQEKAVEFYEELLEEAQANNSCVEYFENTLDYARRHYDVIKQFQRFPHRNAILKRRSTSAELEFLNQPGSSF